MIMKDTDFDGKAAMSCGRKLYRDENPGDYFSIKEVKEVRRGEYDLKGQSRDATVTMRVAAG